MPAIIIDGKAIAQEIKNETAARCQELKKEGIQPTLAVIQVGNDTASNVYVKNKQKACDETGIKSITYKFPTDTSEEKLLQTIQELNHSPINGILVQLPLPKHINQKKVLLTIDPSLDVDGFHPTNVGNLHCTNNTKLKPCTAAGIIELLKRSNITIAGKHAVVIGRSNIVGKPVAELLLKENATVTICHSHTENLKDITKQADILIVAIGKPQFITADFIKPNAVVIDVGIHRNANRTMCGDVDFNQAKEIASYITPVPGGIGPMTIAMLMQNCIETYN